LSTNIEQEKEDMKGGNAKKRNWEKRGKMEKIFFRREDFSPLAKIYTPGNMPIKPH